MPNLNGILETSLYVEDMVASIRFYQEVLQFQQLGSDDRFCALRAAHQQILLLFKKGASKEPMTIDGGTIPPHDGKGQLHLAFAIEEQELESWEEWLEVHRVPVESKVRWGRGGQSLYIRDPDRHLIELVTPGCWAIY